MSVDSRLEQAYCHLDDDELRKLHSKHEHRLNSCLADIKANETFFVGVSRDAALSLLKIISNPGNVPATEQIGCFYISCMVHQMELDRREREGEHNTMIE